MRARFWLILAMVSMTSTQAAVWGGDPLKKLIPMQRICPPDCPPAQLPCSEGSVEVEGTDSVSNDGTIEGNAEGDSNSLAPLPPDSTNARGYATSSLSGLNTDRSSYSSLQSLSSIGDFFAPDGQTAIISGVNLGSGTYTGAFTDQPLSPGVGIGRFKTADSNSPIPRDRLFLDYSLFHNARLTPNDINIQRFVPGIERTFIDGLTSVEIRLPIAMTLNSASFSDSNAVDTQNTEFGNIGIAAKGILWSTEGFVLTSGLVLQTPTADDIVFGPSSGEEAIIIRNTQYRILPYLATLHYNAEWSWQNYVQIDAAANGNKVYINNDSQRFDQIGVLEEQNYLYLDTSLSKWLHRDRRRQTALAMTFELHYNTTINDSDTVGISDVRGNVQLGTPNFTADIVNLNIGPTFVYGATTMTVAYGTPLTEDRGADGEMRVLLNRLF